MGAGSEPTVGRSWSRRRWAVAEGLGCPDVLVAFAGHARARAEAEGAGLEGVGAKEEVNVSEVEGEGIEGQGAAARAGVEPSAGVSAGAETESAGIEVKTVGVGTGIGGVGIKAALIVDAGVEADIRFEGAAGFEGAVTIGVGVKGGAWIRGDAGIEEGAGMEGAGIEAGRVEVGACATFGLARWPSFGAGIWPPEPSAMQEAPDCPAAEVAVEMLATWGLSGTFWGVGGFWVGPWWVMTVSRWVRVPVVGCASEVVRADAGAVIGAEAEAPLVTCVAGGLAGSVAACPRGLTCLCQCCVHVSPGRRHGRDQYY